MNDKEKFVKKIDDAHDMILSPEYIEIEEFMNSIKHELSNVQKQKLNERLFRKVMVIIFISGHAIVINEKLILFSYQSLGLTSTKANNVATQLLNTNSLCELAHFMVDREKFVQKVSACNR